MSSDSFRTRRALPAALEAGRSWSSGTTGALPYPPAQRRAESTETPIYRLLVEEFGDPHIPPIPLDPPALTKVDGLGYLSETFGS